MLNSKSLTFKGQPGLYRVKIIGKDSAIKSKVKQVKVGSVSADTAPPKNIFRVRAMANNRASFNIRQQVQTIQGAANTTYWYRLRAVAKDQTRSDWYYAEPITTAPLGGQEDGKPKINAFLTDLLRAMLFIQGEDMNCFLESSLQNEFKQLLSDLISNIGVEERQTESVNTLVAELLQILPDLEQSFLESISGELTDRLLASASLYVNQDFYRQEVVDRAAGELLAWLQDNLASYLSDVIVAYTYGPGVTTAYITDYGNLHFCVDRLAGALIETGVASRVVPEFTDLVTFLASSSLLEKVDLQLVESLSIKDTLKNILEETINAGVDDFPLSEVRPALYDTFLPLLVAVIFATNISMRFQDVGCLLQDRTSVTAIVGNDAFVSDEYRCDPIREAMATSLTARLTDAVRFWFLDQAHLTWLIKFADYIKASLSDTCTTQPSLLVENLDTLPGQLGEDLALLGSCAIDNEFAALVHTDAIAWVGLDYGGDNLRLGFNEIGVEGTLNPTPVPRRDAFVLGQAVLGETILGT